MIETDNILLLSINVANISKSMSIIIIMWNFVIYCKYLVKFIIFDNFHNF